MKQYTLFIILINCLKTKKNDVVRQINNAKEENERMANKVYNQSLDNIDLNKIEKDLEKRLKELETIND